MGPFKKYVTCIMTFLTPLNYLSYFVNFTLTLPLCYSLNFTKKLQHERKEDFFRIWLLQQKRHIKGGKKSHLETQLNFQAYVLYKQHKLTRQWNYNIFLAYFAYCILLLYIYFRYAGRLFLGYALFNARCKYYQGFMTNQEGIKIELQNKVHRRSV